MAYTDSILFSLPIVTEGPGGGIVVDLTPVFFSDLPQISSVLRGFMMAPDRSSWAEVKGFKDNIELEVAATYASGGGSSLETVPDSRGVTLVIHYSISRLKTDRLPAAAGRQPRGLLPHRGQGLLEGRGRRPVRALRQPLGPPQDRAGGQGLSAGDADHFLD